MIKNNSTPLSTESPIRIDAINTIKYTLLLDYHPPMYDENVESFFSSLFKHCQECCYRIFMDIPERSKSNASINEFFGRSGNWYDDVLSNFSTFPPLLKLNETDIFTPNMYNYIFQHCIISSYHAIQSALNNQNDINAYSIFNNIPNSKIRSSKTSNFIRSSKSHLSGLPFIEKLVLSPRSSEDSLMFSPLFLECWKDICNIDKRNFDYIYDSSKPTYERFNHILNVYEKVYQNDPLTPKQIHKRYILERIFNFDIFYYTLLICEALDRYSPTENYDLRFVSKNPDLLNNESTKSITTDMGFRSATFKQYKADIINLLSLVTDLPNAYSRKYFIIYALDLIIENTNSYENYWKYLDWDNDITILGKERANEPRGFSFQKWREQFILFVNYLSELVFPVYEWCFLGMLMESIEKKYNEKSNPDHMKIALEILEEYINDKNTLLSSPQLSSTFSIQLLFKKITKQTPYKYNNWDGAHRHSNYTSLNISSDTLKLLISSFYDHKPDYNINLSEKLTPSYFRFKTDTSLEGPTLKVRKLYFDILKEYHFKKF